MDASAAWLLLVLYHASPTTYGLAQLGPYATRTACEHSRDLVQHTAAYSDRRMGDDLLTGMCVSAGTTDAP